MVIAQQEVALYLRQRGLLSAEHIVDCDLEIVDISRRNSNFRLVTDRGPSYLLKQGSNPDTIASIANEAAIYRFLQSDFKGDRSTCYLPRLLEHDPKEHVLILEFIKDTRDLHEHHRRVGRFPSSVGATMGRTLATLHRPDLATEYQRYPDKRLIEPPGILSLHIPPLKSLRTTSSASIQVIKILQEFREFGERFDTLRREWRNDTLIHRDLKWDHWLVQRRRSRNRTYRLTIVDWELAGLGDSCWDVGSVFNDYLSFWLFSIPVSADTPPDHYFQFARYPLEAMQRAICCFWQSYVLHMKLHADLSREWLLRAIRYSAVQLAQTTLARMDASTHITGSAICCLQLAHNILRWPEEAISHLLGIHHKDEYRNGRLS